MAISEDQAQTRALSDLRVLLAAAAVADERTLASWSCVESWEALLRYLVAIRLTEGVECLSFLALLSAGAIPRLTRLIVDFASLGRVQDGHPVAHTKLLAETWWPAVRCLGELSHTLFWHTRSRLNYNAYVELRRHVHTLVEIFSSNPIFTLRDQHDEYGFLSGAKLWCLKILEAALANEPDNTDFDRLNAQYPVSCNTRVAAVTLLIKLKVAHWYASLGSAMCIPVGLAERRLRVAQLAADVIARTLAQSLSLEVDFAKLSNVSFDEMIRSFIVVSDEPLTGFPGFHNSNAFALCRLLSVQLPGGTTRDRELTEAAKRTRVLTYSGKLLFRELDAHRAESGGSVDHSGRIIRYEIVAMWFLMMGRAIINDADDPALAQEVIEADVLFTLELWSMGCEEVEFELVEGILKACLIGARTCSTRVRRRFLDQLWTITCRVRNTPGLRAPGWKVWSIGFATCAAGLKENGYNDRRVRNEAKLSCTVPGCKTLGPAATLCGRCKTPYCSQQCQKQDWHIHKQSCAKPKKESQ